MGSLCHITVWLNRLYGRALADVQGPQWPVGQDESHEDRLKGVGEGADGAVGNKPSTDMAEEGKLCSSSAKEAACQAIDCQVLHHNKAAL